MNAEQGLYRIHGLQVLSDVELDGDLVEGPSIDARVETGPSQSVSAEPGDGPILAEYVAADRRWYTATQSPAGYLLRFHGTCDVLIDPQKTILLCRPEPAADPDVLPVLISGTGLAFLLGLRGSLVLHASAVQMGAGSVAFVGLPGMGKSTLAALICSTSGRLITDDALRVETDGVARCFRGTSSLRLRQGATSILTLSPETTTGTSPDGRLTFRPPSSEPECSLSLVVIPRLSREATRIDAHQVEPAEAVYRLSPFLRIAHWRTPDLVSRHFKQLGELASRVPTLVVTVPWAVPFTSESATELAASVEALM